MKRLFISQYNYVSNIRNKDNPGLHGAWKEFFYYGPGMLAALDSCVVWNGAGSKQLGTAAVGVKDTAAACQEFKFHNFHLGDGFVITAVPSVMGPSGPILVSLCLSNSITILVKK